jgi:hypothetical protein
MTFRGLSHIFLIIPVTIVTLRAAGYCQNKPPVIL